MYVNWCTNGEIVTASYMKLSLQDELMTNNF